ncbi:MAG: hypothetical protein PHE17_04715 [Thiothrix sp.]|jgi:hypothetical protein|uniref:hypothetical protein n=1 Tax=Thiothrix sp. TaxID=1032 RepID=UPI00262ADBA3|nr:hypothetical protein [Thiothrix sp.]MDD5392301.1 hypothetical protein [Thiothrix sp.]
MKIKSQLTLATLIVAGLFATGCQQMQQTEGASSQQVADNGGGTTGGGATGNTHNHPEAPDCAKTKSHSHPFKDPNHKHTYGCLAGQQQVVVPKVKAKGNYKGPVAMDDASKQTMQQYQK